MAKNTFFSNHHQEPNIKLMREGAAHCQTNVRAKLLQNYPNCVDICRRRVNLLQNSHETPANTEVNTWHTIAFE